MSVYFATYGEYMKIGFSDDPIGRSTTITRSGKRPADIPYRADVTLLGWIPGDVWREREIHVQHIEHRVVGEWFRLEREVADNLIWADPCGVDIHRMSAAAVFSLMNSAPGITRADVQASGVAVMGVREPADARLSKNLSAALRSTAVRAAA